MVIRSLWSKLESVISLYVLQAVGSLDLLRVIIVGGELSPLSEGYLKRPR
jgi:hypothetical protein